MQRSSVAPARAVILAVDPGAKSGFCEQWPSGVIGHAGCATTSDDRSNAVHSAASISRALCVPLVIVAESHSRFGRWSASAAAGTAAQWGRWMAAIEDAGLDTLPKLGRHKGFCGVVRVTSEKWYRAVVGNSRGWKQDAREIKLQRTMQRMACNDPDEACARAIATWASLAPEVDAVLPAAFRRAK